VRELAHTASPPSWWPGGEAVCTIGPFKTLLAHPWELGSLPGRTVRRQTRGCSVDSSCELLRSLYYFIGVRSTAAKCHAALREASASVAVLAGLRESEGEHSLRQPARRMGGYGWMWRLGVYCCDSHLCEDPSLWPRWVSLLLSSSSLVLKFQRHASSVRHEASPRLIHPPHP
jgi:hypothetical protein